MWRARNAYECYIEGVDNAFGSGELPTMGAMSLPSGKYKITALGERSRRAVAFFEIK